MFYKSSNKVRNLKSIVRRVSKFWQEKTILIIESTIDASLKKHAKKWPMVRPYSLCVN